MTHTRNQPAPQAHDDAAEGPPDAFKVGETVVVEGVVMAVWPGDGSIPPGVSVKFASHAQPVGGWTRTPVPASIVRKAGRAA